MRLLCLLLLANLVLNAVPQPRAAAQDHTTALSYNGILPIVTGEPQLDGAEQVALAVIAHDLRGGTHLAAPYYNSAWIRDSYAWGMIPWSGSASGPVEAYAASELHYWLDRQQQSGAWITNPWSGWYDETPVLIAAIYDAYRLDGNRASLRAALPQARRAWNWLAQTAVQPAHGSHYLLFAEVGPHIAADWADQIARHGDATGLEALWYHATLSMGMMEMTLGNRRAARGYRTFAAGIAADINTLLWRVSAPHARNAQPVAAFGHYTGWLGGTDYFELDSNFLCILYGIATPERAGSIMRFTTAHAGYLLQTSSLQGLPARVLYGDYEPSDYARIHDRISDGSYQNAYWASVGALVAIVYSQHYRQDLAHDVLRKIAAGFLADGGINEWYKQNGAPSGAAAYQWPARMYIVALYAAYLGLHDNWSAAPGRGAIPRRVPCIGPGSALLQAGNTQLTVAVRMPVGRKARVAPVCSVTVKKQRAG